MRSKAPLLVFVTTFVTFLMAFTAVLLVLRQRQAELRSGISSPGEPELDAATQAASLALLDRPSPPRTGGESQGETRCRGRVRDPSGRRIEAAEVWLLSLGQENDPLRILGAAVTDEEGAFETTLPPGDGEVHVLVRARDYSRGLKGLRPQGGLVDAGDIVLGPGISLTVAVSGERSGPIQGASVVVRDPDPRFPPELRRPDLSAVSDVGGTASVVGGDFGSYEINVSKPGFAPWTSTVQHGEINGDQMVKVKLVEANSYIEGTVTVTTGRVLTSGNVVARPTADAGNLIVRGPVDTNGSFRLGPLPRGKYELDLECVGMVQRSRIQAEAGVGSVQIVAEHAGQVSGKILVAGRPRDVELALLKRDERGTLLPYNGARGSVQVEDSSYSINGIPPGRYLVRVGMPGFAPGRSGEFEITPGDRIGGIDVRVGAGGKVSGMIQNVRNGPIKDVTITSFEGEAAPSPALVALYSRTSRASVLSDAQGRFELKDLSPGPQVLVFEATGLPPRTLGPVLISEARDAVLGRMVMGGGGSISGTLHAADQAPVTGSPVLLESATGGMRFVLLTDAQGSFSVRGLPAETYSLRPLASENAVVESVDLAADEHLRRDLRME